jgi:aspartate-semialdehyde dehydrogenase
MTSKVGEARIAVALLGATGSVGQKFVERLAGHPWFELRGLAASERSVGKRYGEAVSWFQSSPLPAEVAALRVVAPHPDQFPDCGLVFSCMDASVAGEIENTFAEAGRVVVSNAHSHRMDRDVPLIVPEVNPDHLTLANRQNFGAGKILTNPNCSTIGLALALKPLVDAFGVREVAVVTLQALSGAGLPGVSALHGMDNVIPYIPREEEKMQSETRKILGDLENGGIRDSEIVVSAQCNRVAVLDGHTQCVSVRLGEAVDEDRIRRAWSEFAGEPQALGLPSAPAPPIRVLDAEDAPQPRLHRDLGRGMTISVGRLRPCPILGHKFVTLSHNTVRGAAGGALLVAELAAAHGLVPGFAPSLPRPRIFP